jgi:hypothetical protein
LATPIFCHYCLPPSTFIFLHCGHPLGIPFSSILLFFVINSTSGPQSPSCIVISNSHQFTQYPNTLRVLKILNPNLPELTSAAHSPTLFIMSWDNSGGVGGSWDATYSNTNNWSSSNDTFSASMTAPAPTNGFHRNANTVGATNTTAGSSNWKADIDNPAKMSMNDFGSGGGFNTNRVDFGNDGDLGTGGGDNCGCFRCGEPG